MRSTTLLVSTPTGDEWRIARRWVTRGRPRWRTVPAGKATGEAFSVPDIGDPHDLVAALGIILGAVVVAVIVIPLLLFGVELIVVGFVVAGGVIGRGLLGRPWIVEARPAGTSVPVLTWRVRGWRRSARLIDEVAAALSAGLDPPPVGAQIAPLRRRRDLGGAVRGDRDDVRIPRFLIPRRQSSLRVRR